MDDARDVQGIDDQLWSPATTLGLRVGGHGGPATALLSTTGRLRCSVHLRNSWRSNGGGSWKRICRKSSSHAARMIQLRKSSRTPSHSLHSTASSLRAASCGVLFPLLGRRAPQTRAVERRNIHDLKRLRQNQASSNPKQVSRARVGGTGSRRYRASGGIHGPLIRTMGRNRASTDKRQLRSRARLA